MASLYAKSFYGLTKAFHHIPVLPRWTKAGLGGLGVGLLGMVMPEVLHTGYGWVQLVMDGRAAGVPALLLVAFPFAKILATSLCIGSGGSGGIFGPGMVIGAMLGAALWRLGVAAGFPGMPDQPAPS